MKGRNVSPASLATRGSALNKELCIQFSATSAKIMALNASTMAKVQEPAGTEAVNISMHSVK